MVGGLKNNYISVFLSHLRRELVRKRLSLQSRRKTLFLQYNSTSNGRILLGLIVPIPSLTPIRAKRKKKSIFKRTGYLIFIRMDLNGRLCKKTMLKGFVRITKKKNIVQ